MIITNNRRINVCMSGGRTSAYMTEMLLSKGIKPIITFANTGWEHEETLNFVNNCDMKWQEEYGVSVVWLETVVNSGKKPSTHKIVNFETASRCCEPFLEVIKKYGVPNVAYPHCTRELKENPIMSYMVSLGETIGHVKNKQFISSTYDTYIGIRMDESKRLKGRRDGKQYKIYPLAEWYELACDKLTVLDFWEDQSFNLNIPEHLGNCIGCYKKSRNKLFKVIRDLGESAFYFPAFAETCYGNVGPNKIQGVYVDEPRTIYRENTNTRILVEQYKNIEFRHKTDDDEESGCVGECDPFMQDNSPVVKDIEK